VLDAAFLTVVLLEGFGRAFLSLHGDNLSWPMELLRAGPADVVQSRQQGRCKVLFARYGRGNVQMANGDRLWG